jgi:hypothetical protein
MKFVIFCNFFRIFWTPNGQKRLVATASTRGADVASRTNRKPPPRSRPTLSPARRPRQCVARLTACLSPGRALQRGRERGGFACSRRARAASPGNALSPGSRLRSGERSAVPPVLQPALAPALRLWFSVAVALLFFMLLHHFMVFRQVRLAFTFLGLPLLLLAGQRRLFLVGCLFWRLP